jgi:hypothetical protein
MNAGEGGQLDQECREKPDADCGEGLHRSMIKRSRDATGVEVGQARRMGMSGITVVGRGVRDRTKLIGMRGRLKKACQGQADGSSVRRRSNILIARSHELIEMIGHDDRYTLSPKIPLEHMHRMQC